MLIKDSQVELFLNQSQKFVLLILITALKTLKR